MCKASTTSDDCGGGGCIGGGSLSFRAGRVTYVREAGGQYQSTPVPPNAYDKAIE
jgi:hypothetical protein